MRKLQKGSTIVSAPLILFFSVMIIVLIGYFFMNLIFPFLWYEKLNSISQKYMYIIEKYGYLTDAENENLISDLEQSGFDISNIEIEAPNKHTTYGELLEFKLKYKMKYIVPNLSENSKSELIEIVVNKNSYCKI
ncbi:MAG: hypothetical protein PHP54_00895 [Clostridia bacterium]|nr:hypothetical protein [Clostridia bacterium]